MLRLPNYLTTSVTITSVTAKSVVKSVVKSVLIVIVKNVLKRQHTIKVSQVSWCQCTVRTKLIARYRLGIIEGEERAEFGGAW